MLRWAFLVLSMAAYPVKASTYATEQLVCPIGGEKFQYMALASISRWGAMPDGMPLGSGYFPIQPAQCPGNGLIMYRDFTADDVKTLTVFIGSPEFLALRKSGETPYYLAYRIARRLGDKNFLWLLLNATWEAKNADPLGERARRYDDEFVALVSKTPVDATDFESIALRARAANALRELGRFDEAENLRVAITIAPTAGGSDSNAAQNREGWSHYLASLASPIARKDSSRAPIDMVGNREAVFRCLSGQLASKQKLPAPAPLTAFETSYCARPDIVAGIADVEKRMAR